MPVELGYCIHYVDEVEATIAFFERAFGLERRFVTPEGDYGELSTGQTTLAFASGELASANLAEAGGFVPLEPQGRPIAAAITLLTEDVDATVSAALGAGARQAVAPSQKPWGQTVAYLRDPSGILIEVATPIAAPPG